jgi:hypothetical protein
MLSEEMFNEFMRPYYREVIPKLKERGIIAIVDSDGDVSAPAFWFEESGVDGILPLERQAGVDIARLRKDHPQMRFIGHFDKMTMNKGEAAMRAEWERLLPTAAGGGFLVGCDHQRPRGLAGLGVLTRRGAPSRHLRWGRLRLPGAASAPLPFVRLRVGPSSRGKRSKAGSHGCLTLVIQRITIISGFPCGLGGDMDKKRDETVTFKADESLLAAMKGIRNRSEFIRSAILGALDCTCPLCGGTGILTPDQKKHWDAFAQDHSIEECADCHEVHLVCAKARTRTRRPS